MFHVNHLITVTHCDKILYRCAVYGNDIDKILMQIADRFSGRCYFCTTGYFIDTKDYSDGLDVDIEDLDGIFLS